MILITEFMNENAIRFLKSKYEVIYDKSLADNQKVIPNKMGGIKAIIVRNRTKVTQDLLNQSPNLSCVGRLGVGLDNINLEACKKNRRKFLKSMKLLLEYTYPAAHDPLAEPARKVNRDIGND